MNKPETVDRILRQAKTIAVVGLSESPGRASAGVSRAMQDAGYRIVPVNPSIASALGETSYPTLEEAQAALAGQGIAIDLVNVFRASKYVPEIVDEVLRLRIAAVWLQLGVCDEEAAARAEAAGVLTVMDRCLMQEHARWSRRAGSVA